MVKPSKIGNKPVLCRNCSKKSKNKQTVEYKNGLYYKLGTKLIVKIDPYGVNKRVTS